MSILKRLKELTDDEILEICDTYTSASEYLRSQGISGKGQYSSILNDRRETLNLEWKLKSTRVLNKVCPVCNKEFKPGYKAQTTCGHSCSNTHFRSGENHPNYLGGYRAKCFSTHEKKCIICNEDKIVAVHHYDEDHSNDSIENLIPLCPTHHGYVHSRYRDLVQPTIDEWRNKFMRAGHSPNKVCPEVTGVGSHQY